jgi:O-succinylbenzoate synthase
MAIERVELNFMRLPYVHFFETSFGRSYDRTFIMIRVYESGLVGYGESVAEEKPLIFGRTTETAWHLLRIFWCPSSLARKLLSLKIFYRGSNIFKENRMAKAGLELALWT